MPTVGGGSAFDANHEPSLEEPSSSSSAAAAAASTSAAASSPSPALKRRIPRSASHSNHDVKWPTQEENVIKETLEGWGKRVKEGASRVRATYAPLDYAASVLPCVRWLSTYSLKSNLLFDVLAGASVAALVVPQGMSYARLAGLPQEYGLYGAFVPVMVYAALGSSRHLAVGPVAVTSMIIGSSLPGIVSREHPGFRFQSDPNKPTDAAGQDRYNRAAIQVAFLAGVFYTLVGVLRLGFFTNFLSHSVISGFMTGAATLIGLTQMKFFFGYDSIKNKNWSPDSPKSVPQYTPFPRGQADDRVVSQLRNLFSKEWLAVFKWRDFVMASAWLVLLLIMKEAGKRSRRLVFLKALGPLTVTGLSIAVTAGLHQGCPSNTKEFNPKCVRVVGKVPKGLPHETVSWWFPMPHAGAKIGLALLVCAIDVLESVSIAKALAYKNGYELAATQELTGLGLANIVGAAFQCYTTTGSFSRSAIMDSVGARTQVAGWVGGLLVMLVLLLLTPIFRNMPQNAQGAIIVSALIGLLQTKEWRFLWRVNKFDWLVFNAAMLGVWFAGVEIGLSISIGLSVALALYNAAFPHTAVLGRLPGTTVYRNVRQYASAKQIDGMLLVRVDAPLFFANVGPVADALRLYEKQYNEAVASAAAAEAAAASPSPPSKEGGNAAAPPPNPPPSPALPDGPRSPLRAIVLDLSPVSDMDASAVHFLSSLVARTRVRGVELALANPSCQVARQMARAKLDSLVGRDRVYVRVGDAVDDLRNALPLVAGGGAAADDTAKEEEEEEKEKEKEEKKKASGDEKV